MMVFIGLKNRINFKQFFQIKNRQNSVVKINNIQPINIDQNKMIKKLRLHSSNSSVNDSDDEKIVEDLIEEQKQKKTLKILLLGSGDSGKSFRKKN